MRKYKCMNIHCGHRFPSIIGNSCPKCGTKLYLKHKGNRKNDEGAQREYRASFGLL